MKLVNNKDGSGNKTYDILTKLKSNRNPLEVGELSKTNLTFKWYQRSAC